MTVPGSSVTDRLSSLTIDGISKISVCPFGYPEPPVRLKGCECEDYWGMGFHLSSRGPARKGQKVSKLFPRIH